MARSSHPATHMITQTFGAALATSFLVLIANAGPAAAGLDLGAQLSQLDVSSLERALPTAPSGTELLTFEGGLLSASFADRSLGDVLDGLTRVAPVSVHWMTTPGAEPISRAFDGLPLKEGIVALLGHRGFALLPGAAGRLQLWVGQHLGENQVPAAQSGAPSSRASTGKQTRENLERFFTRSATAGSGLTVGRAAKTSAEEGLAHDAGVGANDATATASDTIEGADGPSLSDAMEVADGPSLGMAVVLPETKFVEYLRVKGHELNAAAGESPDLVVSFALLAETEDQVSIVAEKASPEELGARLTMLNPDTEESFEVELAAEKWKRYRNGRKLLVYSDEDHASSPCERLEIYREGHIEGRCSGDSLDFTLDEESQGELAIELAFGENEDLVLCTIFGPESDLDERGAFSAVDAPVPSRCATEE